MTIPTIHDEYRAADRQNPGSGPAKTLGTGMAIPDAAMGPARVIECMDGVLRVEWNGTVVTAVSALPMVYRFSAGDIALAIASESTCYVIGVISGSGTSVITSPADLEVLAPRGRIRFRAAEGMEFVGPRFRVKADLVEVVAEALRERIDSVDRIVRSSVREALGRITTKVAGTALLRANRIVQKAKDDVKIDGRKIHLG